MPARHLFHPHRPQEGLPSRGRRPPISSIGGSPCLSSSPTPARSRRSEEHTSELQSLMRISYAVFCLKKKNQIELNLHPSHTAKHSSYLDIPIHQPTPQHNYN